MQEREHWLGRNNDGGQCYNKFPGKVSQSPVRRCLWKNAGRRHLFHGRTNRSRYGIDAIQISSSSVPSEPAMVLWSLCWIDQFHSRTQTLKVSSQLYRTTSQNIPIPIPMHPSMPKMSRSLKHLTVHFSSIGFCPLAWLSTPFTGVIRSNGSYVDTRRPAHCAWVIMRTRAQVANMIR